MSSTIDVKTGQKLFTPVINKKPKNQMNYSNNNVFENNYAYKQKYNEHKHQLSTEATYQIKKESSIIHTNSITDNIFTNLKESAFKRLFRILDSDEDGIISIFYYNSKGLPNNIIKILQPMFDELKKNLDNLNEVEFISALSRIFDVVITFNNR